MNVLEERLNTAGDTYVEYQEYLEANAGLIGNFFEMAAGLRELRRIEQMLDERAPWTVLTESCIASTPSERVAAVLSVLEMRSVKRETV